MDRSVEQTSNEYHNHSALSIKEKQDKIDSNYETIEVLRQRLEESQKRDRTGMNRVAYIKMIFEATKKVDKQNGLLGKAVLETRELQRDIKSLAGRIDRVYKQVESTALRVCLIMSLLFHKRGFKNVAAVHRANRSTSHDRFKHC